MGTHQRCQGSGDARRSIPPAQPGTAGAAPLPWGEKGEWGREGEAATPGEGGVSNRAQVLTILGKKMEEMGQPGVENCRQGGKEGDGGEGKGINGPW